MKLTRRAVQHLFLRAGFGALPAELDRWEGKDVEDLVDHLFNESEQIEDLNHIPDPLKGRAEVSNFRVLAMILRSGPEMQNLNFHWLYRMVESRACLREKATLFWHGHFATSAPFSYLMQGQNNFLRRHALGSFRDLLHGIAQDPAMIIYLNNQENHKDHPNENFAREVMELFTLGIGNYTEHDIREAARAFTGWKVNRKGKFEIIDTDHDTGTKVVLGKTGPLNGTEVLDLLLAHPALPDFLSGKLLRFYFHPNPSAERIREIAVVLQEYNFHVGKTLRHLFTRDWFYDASVIGSMIAAPVPLLVRMIRYFGIEFERGETLLRLQQNLGQTLFFPPNVAGWKGHRDWIDSASLLLRLSLADRFLRERALTARGRPEFEETSQKKLQEEAIARITARFEIPEKAYGAQTPDTWIDALSRDLLTTDLSSITRKALPTPATLKDACIAVCSLPEFQLV